MIERLRRTPVAFWFAAAAVAALHVLSIVPGFWLVRLWEDEAYNLSVPLDLARGLGYASSGLLTTGQPDPFDVRISTGPVVLLPIAGAVAAGIDPVVAGRLVMALFAVLLAAALFLVGRRVAGPWGGLLAAAAPLGFDASALPSPIQAPTDVLGEYPAAAFLVLAFLFLLRRPALAGLFLGLAIQSKTLMVLSLPALGLAVLFGEAGAGWGRRLLRAVRFGLTLALPTVLFELVKVVSLGPAGYVASTRDLYYFLRSGGQVGYIVEPGAKLEVLLASWSLPTWLAGLVVVVLLISGVAAFAVSRRRGGTTSPEPGPETREGAALLLTVLGVLASWLAWWLVSRHDPAWIRHPAPGLLATVPVLVAFWWGAVARAEMRGAVLGRWIRAGAAAALVTLLVGQAMVHLPAIGRTPYDTLGEQRLAAEVISRLPGNELRGDWGRLPSIAFLAGRRAVIGREPRDPRTWWLTEAADRSLEGVTRTRALIQQRCGSTLETVGIYVLCEPQR